MTKQAASNRGNSLNGMYLFTTMFAGMFLYFGFQELRYSLFAETATATVTHKSQEMRNGGRGGPRPVLVLDYSFRDANGTQRNEQDVVPPDWREDRTVLVEYIPGAIGSSRVKGAKSPGVSLLLTGVFAVIGGVVIWVFRLNNAKTAVTLEPLPAFASTNVADNSRTDRRQKRDRKGHEFPEPKEGNAAVPSELGGPSWHRHESGVPMFATDSLVCRYAGWMGKPVSVIVDRSAGMIHFQNCLRPAKFWATSTEPWFSCRLSEIKAAHHCNDKGRLSLVIATQMGRARVSADASNYAALCDAMASFVPHGFRVLHEDDPAFGYLMVFVLFGGMALSFYLTPKDASLTTYYLATVGTGIAVLVLLFIGVKSQNR